MVCNKSIAFGLYKKNHCNKSIASGLYQKIIASTRGTKSKLSKSPGVNIVLLPLLEVNPCGQLQNFQLYLSYIAWYKNHIAPHPVVEEPMLEKKYWNNSFKDSETVANQKDIPWQLPMLVVFSLSFQPPHYTFSRPYMHITRGNCIATSKYLHVSTKVRKEAKKLTCWQHISNLDHECGD